MSTPLALPLVAQITAFPDVNYFLHFRSLDQVDWLKVLGAEAVTIVIAPVTLRELNTKKDLGETKKLRKRADSCLKKLANYLKQTGPVYLRWGFRGMVIGGSGRS